MIEKTFRGTAVTEAGNGRWRVEFREVIEEGAPGSPMPTQDSFSMSMSLEEALGVLGTNQTVTIAPVVEA